MTGKTAHVGYLLLSRLTSLTRNGQTAQRFESSGGHKVQNPDGLGESRIVNSVNKGNGRVSALPESPIKKEDGYEGNDENSICSSNARVGGCDRGDGGSHMVGARRNRHSAVSGCGGVFRIGRWSDLVHGRLGAQEGKIGAKSFYEVKGGGFYEVKSYWLYFGRFFGRNLG